MPAAPDTALARAEQLAERVLPDRSPKRRMLVIVNPYATTVSDRLRNLVVYALQGRYQVEAVDTERREHATQICREAAAEGYDAVVAFGWRRHRQRGRQRPDRLPHPAHVPARRLDQRLLPHARHPGRRGRRHRAPAPHGRRLPAARGRHRPGERPPLRLRLGDRARRQRGRARRQPPAAEAAARRVVLHVGRDQHLQPPLPRAAAAGARRDSARQPRRRDRDRPELGPVHLLRPPPDPRGRRAGARQRQPRRGRAEARHGARDADADPAGVLRAADVGAAPPPGAGLRAARALPGGDDRRPPFPLQVDGDFVGEFEEALYEAAPNSLTVVS